MVSINLPWQWSRCYRCIFSARSIERLTSGSNQVVSSSRLVFIFRIKTRTTPRPCLQIFVGSCALSGSEALTVQLCSCSSVFGIKKWDGNNTLEYLLVAMSSCRRGDSNALPRSGRCSVQWLEAVGRDEGPAYLALSASVHHGILHVSGNLLRKWTHVSSNHPICPRLQEVSQAFRASCIGTFISVTSLRNGMVVAEVVVVVVLAVTLAGRGRVRGRGRGRVYEGGRAEAWLLSQSK